ncbi:MAG: radical SAM protein [Deltaproteobacteria bacterium]|nr:radical SAM protein [Deltaproteobacteria bacterium]
MRAPLYPLEGVVSWNMNTTCNYRCSYCTQRFSDDRSRWAADLPRFLEAFLALPGDWELKLSGGEPFRHPNFLEAVQALAAGGRRVSVVTNLSADREVLAAYCDRVRVRPGVISASLHPEYVAPTAFLEKCRWVADRHQGPLVITVVATQALLPRLPAWIAEAEALGLRLKLQPEKQDREVIDYAPEERQALIQLGGHGGTGRIDPNFEGRACWAGSRYFIVDHLGEAYRCYPARRYRSERLGNLLDGSFRLRPSAEPCRYRYCNCVVPQERGMVDAKEPDVRRTHEAE